MEGPLVISNTTPLINFAEIGCLDLLGELFGTVVIPPAVEIEVMAKSGLFAAAAEAIHDGLMPVLPPKDVLLVRSFLAAVHPGESECLALALEHPGSLLLLDDLAAREIAGANGCLYTGTIGCLAEAKKRGLISAIGPLLMALRTRARFWISEPLFQAVLRGAGEA
ncbi:MAG: putative nucleic acid-binding protein contains domain [Verrucomicrobiaceae bacterium]|nr:putative nucleic acid-binding protein contains domain [Verrucomicrobiaceae bacterium]